MAPLQLLCGLPVTPLLTPPQTPLNIFMLLMHAALPGRRPPHETLLCTLTQGLCTPNPL